MKVYVIMQLEANEPDEVIGIILSDQLEEAKAKYSTLQNEMKRTEAIVIREYNSGLENGFICQEFSFWGNK